MYDDVLQYFCFRCFSGALKKNRNAPRPSEVRGGKMSKRLAGIKGCKYKISYGIYTGSPMEITLGQQYNVGEKHTVIL